MVHSRSKGEVVSGEVDYRFRTSTPALKYFIAAAVLLAVLVVADLTFRGDAPLGEALVWAGGAALVVMVLAVLLWLLPVVPEGKLIRVDASGLRAGRKHLPAHRIAHIEVVHADRVPGATWSKKLDGRKIGRTTLFVHGDPDQAVLVRDRDGGARPWWLLETDDPERFVAALQSVAEQPRSDDHG